MPGRGGPRRGQQGKSYPNRSDLNAQPVRTAPSQHYGDAAASAAAQAAVPLAQTPVLGLNAPSTRPGEHVMAGAPQGPGPGPDVLPRPQRDFSAPTPTAPLTPRDRLQVLLQAGLDAGVNVDDLSLLVEKLSR
jgi:hypothetical protein